jgi:hypothetical protein
MADDKLVAVKVADIGNQLPNHVSLVNYQALTDAHLRIGFPLLQVGENQLVYPKSLAP